MEIFTLTLGAYQTNTYIVAREGNCIIIDPGYDAPAILSFLKQHRLTAKGILLTHGHFDHVGAVRALVSDLSCPVYLHQAELSMPTMMTAGPLYYTDLYDEGHTVTLAGMDIRILHTPGHTPGSVCLVVENAMFSGDTLFCGSCGRTDLPGGDWAVILRSLRRLKGMGKDYTVYPGHGEHTTLEYERKTNTYLR